MGVCRMERFFFQFLCIKVSNYRPATLFHAALQVLIVKLGLLINFHCFAIYLFCLEYCHVVLFIGSLTVAIYTNLSKFGLGKIYSIENTVNTVIL